MNDNNFRRRLMLQCNKKLIFPGGAQIYWFTTAPENELPSASRFAEGTIKYVSMWGEIKLNYNSFKFPDGHDWGQYKYKVVFTINGNRFSCILDSFDDYEIVGKYTLGCKKDIGIYYAELKEYYRAETSTGGSREWRWDHRDYTIEINYVEAIEKE